MDYPDYKKGLRWGCIGGLAACFLAIFISIGFVTNRLSMHGVAEDPEQNSLYVSFSIFKNLPPSFLIKRAIFVFFIIGVPVGVAAAFRPNTRDNKQKLAAIKDDLDKLEAEAKS